MLSAPTPAAMYNQIVVHWLPQDVTISAGERADVEDWPEVLNSAEGAMFADQAAYLPDDLLVKVDRAAMAVGLETRAPLLDHRIVEFAWSLQPHHRMDGPRGKRVLRETLRGRVPATVVDRAKMGFGVPIAAWLRGSLQAWAADLLAVDGLRQDGFFDAAAVVRRWDEHVQGDADWGAPLWSILMFQAWRHRV